MANIIKTEIQEIRYGVYWITVVRNGDIGGNLANTLMNFRVS